MYIFMYSFRLQCIPTCFPRNPLFRHFPINKHNQIWHLHKKGKGQPGVIIWTNLVVLECPMLYTNFQWSRPFDSEEDFLRFFTIIIWAWWQSWSCDQYHLNKLSFPYPIEAPSEWDWHSGFRGEDVQSGWRWRPSMRGAKNAVVILKFEQCGMHNLSGFRSMFSCIVLFQCLNWPQFFVAFLTFKLRLSFPLSTHLHVTLNVHIT